MTLQNTYQTKVPMLPGPIRLIAFAVLLALKLAGVIAWSWWIVTLPLWFMAALFVMVVAVGMAFTVIVAVLITFFK